MFLIIIILSWKAISAYQSLTKKTKNPSINSRTLKHSLKCWQNNAKN